MKLTSDELLMMAIGDFIIEGHPYAAIFDLMHIAQDPVDFFVGVEALTQLKEIVDDYYEREDAYAPKEDPRYREGPDGPRNGFHGDKDGPP